MKFHISRDGLEIATEPQSSIIGTAIRSRRGRAPRSWGVARIDPEIGSYAIIQFKKLPLCEVAHTPPGIGDLYAGRLPAAAAWSVPLEGAVLRTNLWSHNVRPMNEVPASGEMDLKLPQDLGPPSSEQQFDPGKDKRRGRERPGD